MEGQQENPEGSLSPPKKKGRGPTVGYFLPPGKLKVEWDGKQPYGENAGKFTRMLGTYARDRKYFSISEPSWHKIPYSKKEDAWDKVLRKFDIDEHAKTWTIKSLGKKWSCFKSRLKQQHFDPCTTQEERVSLPCPQHVDPNQWKALISFWESEEGQERSRRNKDNRAKQTIVHTAGSKSFRQIQHEEQHKRGTDQPLGRIEMFKITHIKKDGTIVNDDAIEKIELMNDEIKKGAQDLPFPSPDDAFAKVMGPEKPGRVRGCGHGVTPTLLWGASSSHASTSNKEYNAMKDKISELEEESSMHKEEVNHLKAEQDKLKTQLEEMKRFIASHMRPTLRGVTD